MGIVETTATAVMARVTTMSRRRKSRIHFSRAGVRKRKVRGVERRIGKGATEVPCMRRLIYDWLRFKGRVAGARRDSGTDGSIRRDRVR